MAFLAFLGLVVAAMAGVWAAMRGGDKHADRYARGPADDL